ncbi:MAG: extracellular solute-binding protein [Candidatus Zixiibacteriota bacterium]
MRSVCKFLSRLSVPLPLLFFASAILPAALMLQAGCGEQSEPESAPAGDQPAVDFGTPIDETVTSPVTIDWWHFWTDPTIKPTIKAIVKDFENENPNIKVNLTELTWANGHEKIVVALASGSGPDLLELGSDWIPEFVEAERLTDLTANLSATRDLFVSWEPVTSGGRLYGRPWILGTRVMFYNRDLLAKAGYGAEYIPFNLSQFEEAAYKIDSLGAEISGWGSNAAESHRLYKKFLPFFWSHNASFYSENNEFGVVSSMEGGAALKLYKELHESCSMVETQRRLEDAFLEGKVGCVLSGDWLLKRIRNEKPEFNFATGLFPGKKVAGTSFLGGEYLVVNAASKKKGAALRLLRFITSPESQLRFCKANFTPTPSSIECAKDSFFISDRHFMTFVKQLRLSKAPPFEPTWVYIEDEFEKAVERTLFENIPPFESLHEARRRIQKISRGNGRR